MTKKVSKHLSSYFNEPMGKWPAGIKPRLREMADKLWSLAVREDWNRRCAMCGETHPNAVEAHHLIPRQQYATRYVIENGIALCAHHHQFCPMESPHQNAAGFMQWLLTHHVDRWRWYMDTVSDRPEFGRVKDAAYYCDVIQALREYVEPCDYTRILGVRFAAWLEETE